MSSAAKVASLRQRRRARGLKETTIWLSADADKLISHLVESKGLRNRSEAVQYALKLVAEREPQMQA